MATVIKLKRSEVASSIPDSADLEVGEVAINLADQKIYSKNSDGDIVVVANFNDAEAIDLTAVTSSIIPQSSISYDLGSSAKRWRDLYLSGSTINLGDATISASGEQVVLPTSSKMTVSGSEVELATISASGTTTKLVPLYTKSGGLSTPATTFSFSTNPDAYTFTNFTLANGDTTTNSNLAYIFKF